MVAKGLVDADLDCGIDEAPVPGSPSVDGTLVAAPNVQNADGRRSLSFWMKTAVFASPTTG